MHRERFVAEHVHAGEHDREFGKLGKPLARFGLVQLRRKCANNADAELMRDRAEPDLSGGLRRELAQKQLC